MKLGQITLIIGGLIFTSFAHGRNPFRPQDRHPRHVNRQLSGGKKNKKKKQKKNKKKKPTIPPKEDGGCFADFPLPLQETGCPCFTLETITSQERDLSTLDYCSSYFNPRGDSCPCSSECSCCDAPYIYEYLNFESNYKEPQGGEPAMARFFRSSFSVNMDGNGEGRFSASCYASVSDSVDRDYDDYDYDYDEDNEDGYEEYRVEMGENHGYNINVDLTEEEYDACIAILHSYRDSAPSKCNIEDYEDYDDEDYDDDY